MVNDEETVAQLVQMLQTQNEEFLSLIEEMTSEQMEIAGVQGEWSVKDILAHITYWNKQGIRWIESVRKNETPVMPVDGDPDEIKVGMARINLDVFNTNRDHPLKKIIKEYNETFNLLLKHVKHLEDQQLESTFEYQWAEKPVTGRTVVKWRYWHQLHHMKHIREWLSQI